MAKDFELLPHTADIKLRIYGKTLKELFRNALNGMFQSIGPHAPGCIKKEDRLVCESLPIKREVKVIAPDIELLLVDFLSEALYLSDAYDEAYLDADIHELDEKQIKGTLHGISITGFDVVEIKAVTYHNLVVHEVDGGWQAEVVFDI